MQMLSFRLLLISLAVSGVCASQKLVRRNDPVHTLSVSPDGHAATHLTKGVLAQVEATSSEFPIDFVYCWAGEAVQADADISHRDNAHPDHNSGEGFGEMRWSIKFLEANAPWFNKAYILVNGGERPAWLTEASREKIVMVDRCSLFDKPHDCPTLNTHACQAVMHKIPNLAEHFIAVQDDMLIVNPAQPSDFYTPDGKPVVLHQTANEARDMYSDDNMEGPDKPPQNRPDRTELYHHLPVPMLVSFAQKLESQFPDWFAFVRSHHTRFICCQASHVGNGLSEDFSRIYPHLLLEYNVGVHRPLGYGACCPLGVAVMGQKQEDCMDDKLNDSMKKLMTIQDITTQATLFRVEEALQKKLDAVPESQFVADIPQAADNLIDRMKARFGVAFLEFESGTSDTNIITLY